MTENVYDSHRGLIMKLRGQKLSRGANLDFTHNALQKLRSEFQKATFWRELKNN